MNTRICKKTKIRWDRVIFWFILVPAFIVTMAFSAMVTISDTHQPVRSVQIEKEVEYTSYWLVTVQPGDTVWSILRDMGYSEQEIPDLIHRVEYVNTVEYGFRSPSDLVPGEQWIFPFFKKK